MLNKQDAGKKVSFVSSILVLTIFLVMSLGVVSAQFDTDDPDTDDADIPVSVNIEEETIVDIQPEEFAWTEGTLEPGQVADEDNEINDYGSIFIENLGSVNITQVWAEVSKPTERPFGTGDSSLYDPGNFLAVETEGEYQFIERRDYALGDSQEIVFLDTEDGWDVGRFRNTSQEYFWSFDTTDEIFRIGLNPRTETDTGSTDLTDGCDGVDCNQYNLAETGTDTGIYSTDIVVGGEDGQNEAGSQQYCAIIDTNQDDIEGRTPVDMVKYNPGREGADSAGCEDVTEGLVDPADDPLPPGGFLDTGIKSFIPFGVPSGDIGGGELTIYASSS